jgi:signal peptidase I
MEPPPWLGCSPEGLRRPTYRKWAAAAFAGLALTGVALLRWRPARVGIAGDSMAPALLDGDRALMLVPRGFACGQVVVADHPERPGYEVVKRIVAGPGETAPDGTHLGPDRWWLEGDAPEASTDSRRFGPVGTEALSGRVVFVTWPRGRRGWVR